MLGLQLASTTMRLQLRPWAHQKRLLKRKNGVLHLSMHDFKSLHGASRGRYAPPHSSQVLLPSPTAFCWWTDRCLLPAAHCPAPAQLADIKWGVIGVQWRDVPCWYKPNSPAHVPSWSKPTEQPWWEKAPDGWYKEKDARYKSGRKL
jgi:hypothetical protein